MKGFWAWGAVACLLAAGNTGCYYEQWQNAERSNRILNEDLSRVKLDLQDCELQNRQKDTTIDGLNKQIAAKEQTIASLTAEAQNLREALAKAQAILEAQAGKGPGQVTVIKQALPEELDKALKELQKEFPDYFDYDAEKGALRWKADLLFPLGSDVLTTEDPKIMEAMKKFADIVNSDKGAGFDVIVVGHTCTTPIVKAETKAKFPTNWHLSAGRAIRIMELLAKDNVAMTRMGIMGYGEHRPIADNSSKEGKAKNRRVEIYLVRKGTVQSVSMGVFEVPGLGLSYLAAATETRMGS